MKLVFDSSGKLPDGIYGDYIDFCDLLDQYGNLILPGSGIKCDVVEMQLGIQGIISLKGLLNIPLGNTHAFGSYEGCLAAKSNYMSPCKDSITQEPIETCNPLKLEKDHLMY